MLLLLVSPNDLFSVPRERSKRCYIKTLKHGHLKRENTAYSRFPAIFVENIEQLIYNQINERTSNVCMICIKMNSEVETIPFVFYGFSF